MKMNKNGFSLVELLATITILGILSMTAIIATSRYREKTKQQAYDTMASSAISAMEEYLMDDENEGEQCVTLQELYDNNFIEYPKDPVGSSTCNGTVKILSNSGENSSDDEIISLEEKEYEMTLCCTNYQKVYNGGQKRSFTPDDSCYCE